MDFVRRFLSLDCKQFCNTFLDSLLGLVKLRGVDVCLRLLDLLGKISADSVRQDEISVCQTLHQSGCSKTVSAVV